MFTLILCILGASIVRANINSAHLCDEVTGLDCGKNYIPGEKEETVCGTDGKTYINFCFYSQARCATPSVHIANVGSCGAAVTTEGPISTSGAITGSSVVPTTMATTPSTTTVDHLLQVFCASKDSVTCNTDLEPICGSDKTFYLNQCEFSKATCDNLSMTVKDISFCTS